MGKDTSNLKRPRYPMPDSVRKALEERGLMQAYRERPPYQQNDYLGWITRAKRPETQEKRLRQMLDELEAGGVYMNMPHPPLGKGMTVGGAHSPAPGTAPQPLSLCSARRAGTATVVSNLRHKGVGL